MIDLTRDGLSYSQSLSSDNSTLTGSPAGDDGDDGDDAVARRAQMKRKYMAGNAIMWEETRSTVRRLMRG